MVKIEQRQEGRKTQVKLERGRLWGLRVTAVMERETSLRCRCEIRGIRWSVQSTTHVKHLYQKELLNLLLSMCVTP